MKKRLIASIKINNGQPRLDKANRTFYISTITIRATMPQRIAQAIQNLGINGLLVFGYKSGNSAH